MDEEGEVPLGEDVKQWAAPLIAGLISDRGRRQLEPDKPAVELLNETGRVYCRQAGRGPAGERGPQLDYPVVISVQERYRILGHQVLDTERARQADHNAADAIAGGLCCAQGDVVVCRIHPEGRLAGREQRPAIQPRRP